MSERTDERGERPGGAPSTAFVWLFVLYTGLAAVCIGAGAVGFAQGEALLLAGGLVGLVVVVATAPIALRGSGPGQAAGGGMSLREAAALRQSIRELREAVERFAEEGALSDDARRVINRRRERELLRRAIEEDIAVEDWDAAMVLVKELAERFGYRADAEEFRQKIEEARYQTVDRRVADAVRNLDRLIVQLRWDEAAREAARIGRLFPDSPRVEGLRHRVEAARSRYKSDLERRFLHAAQEDRIDEAMELLKELDHYLTEAEAEPYREVARGVIGKARENLGVQFKLAIQDRRWDRAKDVGERILAEFPNSRMADEIRGMIESLRARAASVGGAARV